MENIKQVLKNIEEEVKKLDSIADCMSDKDRSRVLSCILDLYNERRRMREIFEKLKILGAGAVKFLGEEYGWLLHSIDYVEKDFENLIRLIDSEINSKPINKIDIEFLRRKVDSYLGSVVVNMYDIIDTLSRLPEDSHIYGRCIIHGSNMSELELKYACSGSPVPIVVDGNEACMYGLDIRNDIYSACVRNGKIRIELKVSSEEGASLIEQYLKNATPRELLPGCEVKRSENSIVMECIGTLQDMKRIVKNLEVSYILREISYPRPESMVMNYLSSNMEIDKNIPVDLHWKKMIKLV